MSLQIHGTTWTWNVVPNASIWQYPVVTVGTLCSLGRQTRPGKACQWAAWAPKLNLGRVGTRWLDTVDRRQGSEKHPSQGPEAEARGLATRCRNLSLGLAPRFKNGAFKLLKRLQNLKWWAGRSSDRKCCSQIPKFESRWHQYANPMKSGPFSLLWSLLSLTIVRSIVRLCLCLIHFKTLWFQ